MTNLATIAADIRKHSPGVLPESFTIHENRPCLVQSSGSASGLPQGASTTCWAITLPDDIAEAVLTAVMLEDCSPTLVSWAVASTSPTRGSKAFDFDRYGGFFPAVSEAWRWHKDLCDDPSPPDTPNLTNEGRPSPPPVRAGGSALPPPESQ